jgi:hypothetical protein
MKVILKGEWKRHVRIKTYKIEVASAKLQPTVQFYSADDVMSDSVKAELAIDAHGQAALTIETPRDAKPGLWKAAVCDAAGAQLGVIEIEL